MEEIQELILQSLDAQGIIQDSRNLVLPQSLTKDDVLAALSSLKSREVRPQNPSHFANA